MIIRVHYVQDVLEYYLSVINEKGVEYLKDLSIPLLWTPIF